MAVYPLYVANTSINASDLGGFDFAQAFDTIYLTNRNYPVTKMVRSDHTDWEHVEVAFGPALDAPSAVSATATIPNVDAANSGDSYFPQEYSFIVSAVNDQGQESRGSAVASATNDTELPRNYTTISWTAPAGDVLYYRIYKAHESGSFGFIGESESTSVAACSPTMTFSPFNTSCSAFSMVALEQLLAINPSAPRFNICWMLA